MLTTLILPELLVGLAFQDMMIARKSCRAMKDFASADGVEWTMTHAFYANMGGFVLNVRSSPARPIDHSQEMNPVSVPIDSSGNGSQPQAPTMSMSDDGISPVERPREGNEEGQKEQECPSLSKKENMEMKEDEGRIPGAQGQPENPSKMAHQEIVSVDDTAPTELETGQRIQKPTEERAFHLTAEDLHKLREINIIKRLPTISLEDIEEKSKGDFIVKGTAVVQVLWLLIQVIVRHTTRLPVSQLEIAVLAFSVCTFFTYLFYLRKPQNVTAPTYITADGNNPKLFDKSTYPKRSSWFQSTFEKWGAKDSILDLISRPIPNDIEYEDNFKFIHDYCPWTFIDDGMVVAGTIFGALHCFAWNFQFPSRTERLLWKIAGVGSAAVPLAYTLVFNVHHLLKDTHRFQPLLWILFVLRSALEVFYVLARLYLMVEVFRSLFFLPPEAFITTWSTQIPHLG
jgi:hypothetical protein